MVDAPTVSWVVVSAIANNQRLHGEIEREAISAVKLIIAKSEM